MNEETIKHFEKILKEKSKISGECIEWTGKTANEYGYIYFLKKIWLAHRVSYILANGPIPTGLYICHKCSNKLCINSNHLYAGTAKDNALDYRNLDPIFKDFQRNQRQENIEIKIIESFINKLENPEDLIKLDEHNDIKLLATHMSINDLQDLLKSHTGISMRIKIKLSLHFYEFINKNMRLKLANLVT